MSKQTDAMKDDTKELTLFDNYDFIEKIESLMADCESAEVEFKSARGGFPGNLLRFRQYARWSHRIGRQREGREIHT